jgi:thioredoxin 1
VAEENPDMLFIKVNVDNCENTTIRFQINSVPTLIFFENGKVIKKHNGLINYMNFKEMIAY